MHKDSVCHSSLRDKKQHSFDILGSSSQICIDHFRKKKILNLSRFSTTYNCCWIQINHFTKHCFQLTFNILSFCRIHSRYAFDTFLGVPNLVRLCYYCVGTNTGLNYTTPHDACLTRGRRILLEAMFSLKWTHFGTYPHRH